MIVAAFAVALAGSAQMQPWVDANVKSISQTHDAKTRLAKERAFAQTLRELETQRSATLPVDAANAGVLAERILANRQIYRFGAVQKLPPKTWWDNVVDWVQARWNAIIKLIFGRVKVSGQTSIVLGDILLGSSILVFLFLLARVGMQYAGRSSRANVIAALQGQGDPALLCAQAEEDARRGRYGMAVTKLFNAALVALRNRGELGGDDSETIGQLRRRIRSASPARSPSFDALAAAVTSAVYADAVLAAADWERARAAYTQLAREGERDHAT